MLTQQGRFDSIKTLQGPTRLSPSKTQIPINHIYLAHILRPSIQSISRKYRLITADMKISSTKDYLLIEFYYSLYTICPGNIETRIFCRWHQNIYVSLSFFSHFLLFFLLTIEELWIRKIWIDSNRKHFVVHTHNCCTSKMNSCLN